MVRESHSGKGRGRSGRNPRGCRGRSNVEGGKRPQNWEVSTPTESSSYQCLTTKDEMTRNIKSKDFNN